MREAREKKAATAMEGATEELERRSQYLSSLIMRTKIKSDDATAAVPGDAHRRRHDKRSKDAELPSLQRERRQERSHLELPLQHQRQHQPQQQHQPPQQQKPPAPEPAPRQDKTKKCGDHDADDGDLQEELRNVRIRAADMPAALQKRAFKCAREVLAAMPKLDSKRLALSLKKEFDSAYGPAWHCIVGTSFGSYVTHSLGGFLYFSIDKVYILLFRTAVEPLGS